MSRKLLNDLDGFAVDEYAGTFTGSFDVGGADARYLAYDDEVLLVVRARVKPPRLKEMKNGDIVRVNVLGVKEAAVVRSDELKTHLCDTLGLDVVAPQLTLDDALESDVLELQETLDSETDVEVVQPPSAPAPQIQKFGADESKPELPPEPVESVSLRTTKDARLAAFLAEG